MCRFAVTYGAVIYRGGWGEIEQHIDQGIQFCTSTDDKEDAGGVGVCGGEQNKKDATHVQTPAQNLEWNKNTQG
jgi:hypothetical protein